MHRNIQVIALLAALAAAGCAATVRTQNATTFVDEEFGVERITGDGLAMLPVLAGAGIEGYRRPFGQSIDVAAVELLDDDAYIPWQQSMSMINDAGLALAYGDAIAVYQQTSIIDREIVRQIGEACGSRFLMIVTLQEPQSDSVTRRSAFSGGVYEQQSIGVSAYGQVWDSSTGDVVWEGSSSSGARSDEFSHIREQGFEHYSTLAADALFRAVLGMPPKAPPKRSTR